MNYNQSKKIKENRKEMDEKKFWFPEVTFCKNYEVIIQTTDKFARYYQLVVLKFIECVEDIFF